MSSHPIDIHDLRHRIVYEAFSKFSNKLNKVERIEELERVINRNLKYLFDYRVLRMVVILDGETSVFHFAEPSLESIRTSDEILQHEKIILSRQVPIHSTIPPEHDLYPRLEARGIVNPEVWGWYAAFEDAQVVMSVLADDHKQFTKADVEIAQLLRDNFTTKFRQIRLRSKVALKNQELREALKTIGHQNSQIQEIVENQQDTIEARTEDLKNRNKQLREISLTNAHDIREPLTRIMGLLDLSDSYEAHEYCDTILSMIKSSAEDLDKVLNRTIKNALRDLDSLKPK